MMINSERSTPIVSSQSFTPSKAIEPLGLECLRIARKTAPKHFCFSISGLEEIRTGVNLEEHRLSLLDGTYLHDFLPSLNWWITLARDLANGRVEEYSPNPNADLAIGGFTRKVSMLVREILWLYAAALDSTPDFAGIDRPQEEVQGLEMLKRYRELTICVRDFAVKTWPGRNTDWLWGQN